MSCTVRKYGSYLSSSMSASSYSTRVRTLSGTPFRKALREPLFGQPAQMGDGCFTLPAPVPRDTHSATHPERSCSVQQQQGSVPAMPSYRGAPGRHARADGARRWGAAQAPASDTGTPRRMAVSVSCNARRCATCMCTSPAATRGKPAPAASSAQCVEPVRVVRGAEQFHRQP